MATLAMMIPEHAMVSAMRFATICKTLAQALAACATPTRVLLETKLRDKVGVDAGKLMDGGSSEIESDCSSNANEFWNSVLDCRMITSETLHLFNDVLTQSSKH
ncbi:hypothetical protein BD779DRAFT_1593774 [Infundibulicybe gibba]|nr:hypothetical protein BD779DRAFT_1593774 [Infundibulicybe gibba]